MRVPGMDEDRTRPHLRPWNDLEAEPEQAELVAGPTVAAPDDPDVLATLSQYARGFGVHYETLRRCILEHGVAAAGRVRGHSVYPLRSVYRALTAGADVTIDPERLSPIQQRAYWQARNERQRYEQARGRLVDALDVERTIGQLLQLLVRDIETLPDRAERDRALDPSTLRWLEEQIERIREEMYTHVLEATALPESSASDDASRRTEAKPLRDPKVEPHQASAGGALERATTWLDSALAGGPRSAAELVAAAARSAISEATLRRAKRELGVKAIREGKAWVWTL